MGKEQRVRDGATFRDHYECIASLKLMSKGRDNWPDDKDVQEHKLHDEKVGTERKETKAKGGKEGC